MADRCIHFPDAFSFPVARQRSYAVIEPPGCGLACIDLQFRRGGDWYFARRWVATQGGSRELYRLLDRLEAAGFRFRVAAGHRPRTHRDEEWGDRTLRASVLRSGLTGEERRIHKELFPEECRLLESGYDWDLDHVYKDGVALGPDPYGRILDTEDDTLYEWVRVRDEFSWRRYPLGKVRVGATARGT